MPIPFASAAAALALSSLVQAQAVSPYEGELIVEVDVRVPSQLAILEKIGSPLACRPGVGAQPYLLSEADLAQVRALGLRATVLSDDVPGLLDAENQMRREARIQAAIANAQRGGDSFFADFRTYPEIIERFEELAALRPDLATLTVIGQSIEGRDIVALRLLAPGLDESTTPGVAVTGCQHAREWVSPASVTFLADKLVRGFGNDPEVDEILATTTMYIVPIVNPDGYVYSFPVSEGGQGERLWRKNRRINNNGTRGVDLNRNWAIEWDSLVGTSTNPASDVYRGTSAFSEPETTAVSDYLQTLPNLKAAVDVHSFSQLILGPFGYSETTLPPREVEVRTAQKDMQEAMRVPFGTNYTAGLGVDRIIYAASGTAQDWYFDGLGALGWTYELRDTGQFGFVLPPDQIIPTAMEVFEGISTLTRFARRETVATASDPRFVSPDSPTNLTVQFTPANSTALSQGTEKLWYRTTGGEFVSVTPNPLNGRLRLPAIGCGQTIEYYYSIERANGELTFEPAGGPNAPLVASAADSVVIFDDDMEDDLGWTVQSTASTGAWERGDPQGTVNQPEDDASTDGTLCWVTGRIAGAGAGSNDIDSGETTLTSPAFDLAGADGATITYRRWHNTIGGESTIDDILRVEASSDDGGSWQSLEIVGPTGPDSQGGWRFQSITLTPETFAMTSAVRIRFIASDLGTPSLVEAGIDEVSVTVHTLCGSPCPADADGNGAIDLADLNLVLSNFGATDATQAMGDNTGDGAVDLADLNAVLSLFGQPCE